ncbi:MULTISPECIES: tonB-system energizer ExbB [unclassified Bradyrhizobium]|uniref:tonB-system energizer ExbB n=1 Tax=unclassified Bradyrhizobium TaxID=2631580 RepID=UPI0029169FC8|nr:MULTISPECIES: tonB-system energizer ExbB [unclassified Bradyrhizobium]
MFRIVLHVGAVIAAVSAGAMAHAEQPATSPRPGQAATAPQTTAPSPTTPTGAKSVQAPTTAAATQAPAAAPANAASAPAPVAHAAQAQGAAPKPMTVGQAQTAPAVAQPAPTAAASTTNGVATTAAPSPAPAATTPQAGATNQAPAAATNDTQPSTATEAVTDTAAGDKAKDQAEKPAQGAAQGGAQAASHVPHDLSPWSMFLAADILVKSVMMGLALASLATWTVFIAKTIEFSILRRKLSGALRKVDDVRWLSEAKLALGSRQNVLTALIDAAMHEIRMSSELPSHGVNERAASSFSEIVRAEGRRCRTGMGLLATIGSISPFVGLFGTVWGIMNSFIGISKSQTTNLAVVAPGIAEALLATAIGLVAAIPAVIIYNHFTRVTKGYMELVNRSSGATARMLSRDLDRGQSHHSSHHGERFEPIHVHSAPPMALAAE